MISNIGYVFIESEVTTLKFPPGCKQ